MIDLGNDQIYLDKNEFIPFSCPKCYNSVSYIPLEESALQIIVCSTCDFTGRPCDFVGKLIKKDN
jgi:hypothetical protein